MSVRQWINENAMLASSVAAVVAVVAVVALIWQVVGGGGGAPGQAYYYDTEAEVFFVEAMDLYPPIETPAGNDTGVRAHIRGCNGCPRGIAGMTMDELTDHNAFVAYFERYSTEAKEALEAYRADPQPDDVEVLGLEETGLLVSTADGEQWAPENSQRGMGLVERGLERTCDDGQQPDRCLP